MKFLPERLQTVPVFSFKYVWTRICPKPLLEYSQE